MTETQQCQQCEAEIPGTAQYCPACGVRLPQTPEPAPLPTPRRRWGGTQVVIWFLVIAVVMGVLFMLGVVYFIRHTAIVTTNKNGGRIEAPYGTLSHSRNPAQLARGLGLDLVPGAVGVSGTQADLNHSVVVSIEFRSTAKPAAIMNFYHVRYPDASVQAEGAVETLVQLNPRDTMTIVAEPEPKGTRILVNDVRH
ncbi:MAG: hypothetical protein ACRD04_03005 [Terriglobales bacterium]